MNEQAIEDRVRQEIGRILSKDPLQAIMLAARAIQQTQDEKEKAIQEITAEKNHAISSITKHIETNLMPKVDMYDRVMSSADLREMSTVAKELNFLGMGRNNLFEFLKRKDVLRYNNEPYQVHVNNGYFKVIEQSYQAGDCVRINRKTMCTSKGIQFIAKLLVKDDYARNER